MFDFGVGWVDLANNEGFMLRRLWRVERHLNPTCGGRLR
jgi:hypothetical protein